MSANKDTGLNLTAVLLIIFVVLKLTHNIDWSWWWVLSPLWIPLSLYLVFVVILFIAVIIEKLIRK